MRGHLVGPERNGDMDVDEYDDRIVISFRPVRLGSAVSSAGTSWRATPSRHDPPYNLGVTEEKYDWAWNEQGVCYYCSHCCFALEYWPALKNWGHPLRVVDSPLYPRRDERPRAKEVHLDDLQVP